MPSITQQLREADIFIRTGPETRFQGDEVPDGVQVILPGGLYNDMVAEIRKSEDRMYRLRVWFDGLDPVTRARTYDFFKQLNPQIVEPIKK